MLHVPIPGSDTDCSSRDVQSRSLSIVFSLARCARSVQGSAACPHRVRGLRRSVHLTKLVFEQEKSRTDNGAGWMILMCFHAAKFSNFSTTKTGLNSNVNHPRQNVPTVQTPRPKTLFFVVCSALELLRPVQTVDVQRMSDHYGFVLPSATVERCDICSSQSATQPT